MIFSKMPTKLNTDLGLLQVYLVKTSFLSKLKTTLSITDQTTFLILYLDYKHFS